VKEVLENLNESRRVSFQISLALKLSLCPRTRISCLQALQFLLYALSSLKQSLKVFFSFRDELLKSSFQECIENRAYEEPAPLCCWLKIRKDGILHPPSGCLDFPPPPPKSVRSGGRTLTSTNIYPIDRLQISLPMVLRPCDRRPQSSSAIGTWPMNRLYGGEITREKNRR